MSSLLIIECMTFSWSWNAPSQLKLEEKSHSSTLYMEKKYIMGASLVVQWLRIHLPMQGTQVRALVREDPPCRRATKPASHNYWATHRNYWACVLQLLKPARLEPLLFSKRSHRNEEPVHYNEDPMQPNKKIYIYTSWRLFSSNYRREIGALLGPPRGDDWSSSGGKLEDSCIVYLEKFIGMFFLFVLQ